MARTAGSIEQTVQHVDAILSVTKSEEAAEELTVNDPVVTKLQQATRHVERAVARVEEALNQGQENDQPLPPPPDNPS